MPEGYSVEPGPSIRDTIYAELEKVSRWIVDGKFEGELEGERLAILASGRVSGLAYALAVMINPYDPDAAMAEVRAEIERRMDLEDG